MRAIVFVALSIFVLGSLRAEFANDLADATRPLSEGVPEVAVVRLRGLLAKNVADGEWRAIAEKLAEALIMAYQPSEALSLLDDARVRDMTWAKFWRAQAFADLHRPAEALPLYQEAAADEKTEFRTNAIFGAGEMLRSLQRGDEALQQFAQLLRDPQFGVPSRLRSAELFLDQGDIGNARRILERTQPKTGAEKEERQLLRSRLFVMQHPERAIDGFQSILQKPEGASHSVVLAALFGLADAHLQQKTPDTGDDVLENFIEHHPRDVDLARIFAKLDELYNAEQKPSGGELQRWVRDTEEPRRAFAQWYLARMELRAGHRERAVQLFSALRQSKIKSPELASAFLDFAELQMQDRQFDEAISILNEAKLLRPEPRLLERINLATAEAQYRAKRFDAAAMAFEQTAHSASPLAKMSMLNASIAWLESGNQARFLAVNNELEKTPGSDEARVELRLEEALAQAFRREKSAADSLRSFLRDFPHDKRASEGWVALAELAFHDTPPRLDEARKDLARAAELTQTAAATERADYLMVWIEDSVKANDPKVIELSKAFLDRHAASPMAPDVRLKLAEAYYRRQDFPNAQTQFETLAEQNPSGPFAEKALFFAAESAMSSMAPDSLDRAITLFDRVVRLNGELKWAARNEQAGIERKTGKPKDALLLYEEVLKSDARPEEMMEALCGKGDLLFEMGGSDRKNYRQAIEVYDQLAAAAANDQIQWRNQALFKKGVCLEKEADGAAALAAFYRVVDSETRPNRPHELFWFYKAGFNAARLLEDAAKWQSAAAIYEKLAAAGGLRSEEAKARLNRLRLEHFLWDE
jgi:outer membrane protein assembly factor BamD (BamD/ComL family)